MATYKTPGVYVEEITKFPPSVAQVETAIPAFIGYTKSAKLKVDGDLTNVPHRIGSMLEYETFFGAASPEVGIIVNVKTSADDSVEEIYGDIADRSNYLMYYSLQAFFANGGGPCYIVSVGGYSDGAVIDPVALTGGLDEVAKVDEVTLILFPDGLGASNAGNYYGLQKAALDQCVELQDRFVVMDVFMDSDTTVNNVQVFRDADFGNVDVAKYGASYYPRLLTQYDYEYDATKVAIVQTGGTGAFNGFLSDLEAKNNAVYNQSKAAINDIQLLLPASSSVAGIYAQVDSTRGVWKAPANIGVDYVVKPEIKISNKDQEDLNIDVTAGKSINAIRSFTGRGPAIIWGARTLAGNDNEWRYINVRRFFNMVEESVKKATNQFVFEPNDANTWVRVRAMIENFLTLQWRAGALAGPTTEAAFYVKVGLGETMTPQDILEGRMIVEIGMAAVRPAEFIILKFSHKMQEA